MEKWNDEKKTAEKWVRGISQGKKANYPKSQLHAENEKHDSELNAAFLVSHSSKQKTELNFILFEKEQNKYEKIVKLLFVNFQRSSPEKK